MRNLFNLQSGSIKQHFLTQHNTQLNRNHLTENTSIISTATDKTRLCIKEALLILHENPSINKQYENFNQILKLKPHRRNNNSINAGSIEVDNAHQTHHLSPPTASPASHIHSQTLTVSPPSNYIHSPLMNNTPLTIHNTSPNINDRINSLIQSSRYNVDTDTLPQQRMTLRSHTRRFN